jgi:predicted DNA-binding antitoxin AbrB/MazE fold protein
MMRLIARVKNRRKDLMAGTVRARVKHGMLELLDKIDLPEGKEVSVTILDVPSPADRAAFRRSAGSWKDTVDAETLIKNIYESRQLSTRPVPKL